MTDKTYAVQLTKSELWDLLNAADQAASNPGEHLSGAKRKLSDVYDEAWKETNHD